MPSWSSLCSAALFDEPLHTLLQKLHAVGAMLVRRAPQQLL